MIQLINKGNILYTRIGGGSTYNGIALISTLMYTYFAIDLDDRIKDVV